MYRNALKVAALISGLALASAASASTSGTSLSIKFNNNGEMSATSAAGVPAVQTQNWNLTDGASGTLGSLVTDTAGTASAPTGASITWAAPESLFNGNDGFSGADHALMHRGLDVQGNPNLSNLPATSISISVTGVGSLFEPGYSVYIYSEWSVNGRLGTYTVNSVSQEGVTDGGNVSSYSLDNGTTPGNYLLFTGVSGDLNISAVGFTGPFSSTLPVAAIQGIEIVGTPASMPEPASIGLIGFASVGLLRAPSPRRQMSVLRKLLGN